MKKKTRLQWYVKTKRFSVRALVTGGSSGIGAAIVRKLASQGLNVVVVALDDAILAKFKETIVKEFPNVEFRFVGCDLSEATGETYFAAVKKATEDIDVQILCNNAGFITTGGFADVPLKREMANYHTNVTSGLTLTHYFADNMLNKGLRGLITYTSSSAAFIPNPMSALYGKMSFTSQITFIHIVFFSSSSCSLYQDLFNYLCCFHCCRIGGSQD